MRRIRLFLAMQALAFIALGAPREIQNMLNDHIDAERARNAKRHKRKRAFLRGYLGAGND